MAKWGEGDPRWIVEERPDAINVNNWHWTEKNACGWSKSKFKELFNDFKIIHDGFRVRVTEVEKAEGEANANNRKAKLIFFYEWELTLKWKGRLRGSEDYLTGKFVIPNLSEENELHEIDVNISVNETSEDSHKMKELLYLHARDNIRQQLGKYITGLKEEFSQGMILPKKDENGSKTTENLNNLSAGLESSLKMNANSNAGNTPAQKSKQLETKVDTSTLTLTEKFQCTCSELYNALTVTELVAAFTKNSVKQDVRPGGHFELFGGHINGEFVELDSPSKIVQKWRVRRWPDGIYSTVTIELKQQADHTELILTQKGLPATEVDSTKENWERYYFESLKRTFAFGSFL